MLKSFLKIAWRNISRNKTYSILNILGLTIGLCACTVIYVIVHHEFSFDDFHQDGKRVYRVMGDIVENNGDKLHFVKLPSKVSEFGRSELSGTDAIAGIIPYNAQITIPGQAGNTRKKFESRLVQSNFISIAFTEPQYFSIFKYQWLSGSSSSALDAPRKVVLTENRARQYFGSLPADQYMGRQIIYDDSLVATVSGIIKEWGGNTDLGFTDFISFSSIKNSFLASQINLDSWSEHFMNTWTFIKLSPSVKTENIVSQMTTLVKGHGDPQTRLSLWLQPIADMHFDGDIIEYGVRTADKTTLYSLIMIGVFILALAIINFINLSTAQAIKRSKEVGIRKVLGSNRGQLIFQFLTETFMLTTFAVLVSLMFARTVFDFFRSFIPGDISFRSLDPSMGIYLIAITLVTSALAGFYPARILSGHSATSNIQGHTERFGKTWILRKALVVFQFSISLVFIIGCLVIARQLAYTREKDLGFHADAIVMINTPPGDSIAKASVAANKIRQLPGAAQVALQWVPPMTGNGRGRSIKLNRTDTKETGVVQIAGNEDFIPLYQIKLIAGKNLEHSDSLKEFVINENLSKLMGCKTPADAIGKMLYWDDKPYPVVGVVNDFHSRSFHEKIAPVCIVNRPDREGTIAVKLSSAGKQAAGVKVILAQIEKAWKSVYPNGTFDFQFYDESLQLLYEKDRQTATLMNTAMGIAIFISCLGLFALSLFTTEKRIKEISIRKILGAGIADIAWMLSFDFIILIVIALLVASPVAWIFMNKWLEGFAYRITVSWWMFFLAGAIAICITLVTISFHAMKAALANPVNSLRSE